MVYENKFNHSVFIHSCMLTSRGRGRYIKVMSKNAKIEESHCQASGTKFLIKQEPNPLWAGIESLMSRDID